MPSIRAGALALAVVLTILGCASPAPARPAGPAASPPPAERVLTVSISREPAFVAALSPLPAQQATDFYQRMFNAFLDLYDDQSRRLPYLAEALPALNTDSWVLLPDGRMETRYHLKPDLVWHDGTPLTAGDFVFAFRVAKPANGFRTGVAPYTMMEDVLATDDRSLAIRWKSVYPDAGVLLQGDTRFGLVPLPRHLLEEAFNQSLDAFQGHPYWAHEFVGAGPFKVDRWELGSYLEAVAFDRHVLGRPVIDRIRLLFMPDPNTAFANLLGGSTQVALDTITFAHMLQVKQQWGATNRGMAGISVVSRTAALIQHRPEYANPRAILDLRVHKALAYGMDKHTFAETIWAGELGVLDSIFSPTAEYYPAIDRAITKYPYDPRASERLMSEAGYTKGADGFFASPSEGKLSFVLVSSPSRAELPVLAANWRQTGFDMQEQPLTSSQAVDPEVRGSFSSVYINASSAFEVQQMALYRASEATSAANRWRGENHSGWMNAEFDRLVEAFNVTLDPSERVQQRAQMAKLVSEELPSIVLTFNPNVYAYAASVKNVTPVQMHSTGRITWNIHRWEVE